MTIADLSNDQLIESTPLSGWPQFIERTLALGRTSFLGTQLSKRRFDLTFDDLPALGLQLLEDLDASSLRHDHVNTDVSVPRIDASSVIERSPTDDTPRDDTPHDSPYCDDEPTPSEHVSRSITGESGDGTTQAHAAHRRFQKAVEAATAAKRKTVGPSKMLEVSSPKTLEKLERLDDVVYEALEGQTGALDQLETLWPEILDELGEEFIAESREQYLRHALRMWEECIRANEGRDPAGAIRALDVLCVLFDEVE